MASMKEINLRIKSISGTRQITKAMELVAISKLTKARERIDRTRPFYTELYSALSDVSAAVSPLDTGFCRTGDIKKSCVVVIAGDRGLAGGYNSNLFKFAEAASSGKNICVLPIGKRSIEHFERRGYETVSDEYPSVEDMSVGDCFEISRLLCKMFLDGDIDELSCIYTNFVTMLGQEPAELKLLPLDKSLLSDGSEARFTLVEPGPGAVFNSIIPDTVAGLLWGAVCESFASELAARRTAMESATSNADDIIADLKLKYNKARKSSITQQITEIVSGAQTDGSD